MPASCVILLSFALGFWMDGTCMSLLRDLINSGDER
jgi:hypothetical protein